MLDILGRRLDNWTFPLDDDGIWLFGRFDAGLDYIGRWDTACSIYLVVAWIIGRSLWMMMVFGYLVALMLGSIVLVAGTLRARYTWWLVAWIMGRSLDARLDDLDRLLE